MAPKGDIRNYRKLTDKQKLFVDAYLGAAQGNGLLAVKMAGYTGSNDTLSVTLSNLRVHPLVRAQLRQSSLEGGVKLKVRDLRRFWAELMEDGDAGWRERLKASELLGKSIGAFVDRGVVEHRHLHAHMHALSDGELARIAGRETQPSEQRASPPAVPAPALQPHEASGLEHTRTERYVHDGHADNPSDNEGLPGQRGPCDPPGGGPMAGPSRRNDRNQTPTPNSQNSQQAPSPAAQQATSFSSQQAPTPAPQQTPPPQNPQNPQPPSPMHKNAHTPKIYASSPPTPSIPPQTRPTPPLGHSPQHKPPPKKAPEPPPEKRAAFGSFLQQKAKK